MSNQIKSNQIMSNQIKSNQIKSNQIKSNQIKSNQIKSNQIKSNQIKSNHIQSIALPFVMEGIKPFILFFARIAYSPQRQDDIRSISAFDLSDYFIIVGLCGQVNSMPILSKTTLRIECIQYLLDLSSSLHVNEKIIKKKRKKKERSG
jgi:hypothetical protein